MYLEILEDYNVLPRSVLCNYTVFPRFGMHLELLEDYNVFPRSVLCNYTVFPRSAIRN